MINRLNGLRRVKVGKKLIQGPLEKDASCQLLPYSHSKESVYFAPVSFIIDLWFIR